MDDARPVDIAVIGAGYVGLTVGACLADLGHRVACVEKDRLKLAALRAGRVPFHEPGLAELVRAARERGLLSLTDDLAAAAAGAPLVFIAVGTPTRGDGTADLSALQDVVEDLCPVATAQHVVVVKSTVPVGTTEWVQGVVAHTGASVAANPEFLREGSAVEDFLRPARVVIGTLHDGAARLLASVYRPMQCPILVTDPRTAEMIKYASNAFLATKISFINEVAAICERLGADAAVVAQGMGADPRIGPHFLRAGVGFGGSCLPKDLRALVACARVHDVRPLLLEAVQDVNEATRQRFIDTVESALGGLRGRTLAILGLTFKGGTSDLRESPALDIALRLLDGGAVIRAFDPQVGEEITGHLPQAIRCTDAYDAGEGSDAILLLSDCPEFLHLDWRRIASRVRGRLIIDGRGLPVREVATRAGFVYLGRGDRLPVSVP